MNLTLATSVAIAGLLTGPFLAAAPQEEPSVPKAQHSLVKESEVGLTIFVPKLISASDLLLFAKEMVETKFMVRLADGSVDSRDRFINMIDALGIQGKHAKREQLTALLENLDTRIGAVRGSARTDDMADDVRTMRMKCMSTASAMALLNNLNLHVIAAAVQETGNLVLRGPRETLDQVQRILREADRPLPQLIMHCEILEAVTPVNQGLAPGHSQYNVGPKLLTGDVAEALEGIVPGKKFARRAHLMLRSSIGGEQPIEISSAIAKSFGREVGAPNDPRLVFECIPSGWDPDSQSLTLDDCSVTLEVPNYQTIATGNGDETVKQFTGYSQQRIRSRLSLKAGETTVIGSLGGDPVYVALRFTVR